MRNVQKARGGGSKRRTEKSRRRRGKYRERYNRMQNVAGRDSESSASNLMYSVQCIFVEG